MERRQFLKRSVMTGAALAFSGEPMWAKSADARVEIFVGETKAEISPNIYGQFTEHIGGVIYDGVWVGERSKIRNKYGIRAELVEKMNQIHVPILRWPGGCFADSYDWKDGIGPRAKRPKRTIRRMRRGCTTRGRRSSSRTSSGRTSLCGSAS